MDKSNDLSESVIFPKGEKLPSAFSKNFVGQAWLQMLVPAGAEFNCPIGNVTFEPVAVTAGISTQADRFCWSLAEEVGIKRRASPHSSFIRAMW